MRTKHGWQGADWKNFTPGESDRDRYIIRGGYSICRYDIPKILSDASIGYLYLWGRYKRYGWPYSGGWAEQPAVYVDIVDALEDELDKEHGERTS